MCGVGQRRETGQVIEDSGTGPGVAADAGAEEEQTVALIQDTARDSELAGPRRCCGCTCKPLQPLTKLFREQNPWKREDILQMSTGGLER